MADDTGLSIAVWHPPPGTSKWNKVEHRFFSHITLIADTTTVTGLKVQCQLDTNAYPTGVPVSDPDLETVHLERSDFHGDWNCVIRPRNLS